MPISVATNRIDRWFFIFGFSKNERENISPTELESLRKLAGDLLDRSMAELDELKRHGALDEINDA